jgi:hypothetical protein
MWLIDFRVKKNSISTSSDPASVTSGECCKNGYPYFTFLVNIIHTGGEHMCLEGSD